MMVPRVPGFASAIDSGGRIRTIARSPSELCFVRHRSLQTASHCAALRQGSAAGSVLSCAYGSARGLALTLLLAAAVLWSQTLGQQHVHVDHEQSVDCVVCLQSDHTPLPRLAMATAAFVAAGSDHVSLTVVTPVLGVLPASYLSRAPPKA